ncbi:MAG: hypothetical protein AVDCRST_MAG89-1014, partial [uncultured Gemmatimonadetes bacterium]
DHPYIRRHRGRSARSGHGGRARGGAGTRAGSQGRARAVRGRVRPGWDDHQGSPRGRHAFPGDTGTADCLPARLRDPVQDRARVHGGVRDRPGRRGDANPQQRPGHRVSAPPQGITPGPAGRISRRGDRRGARSPLGAGAVRGGIRIHSGADEPDRSTGRGPPRGRHADPGGSGTGGEPHAGLRDPVQGGRHVGNGGVRGRRGGGDAGHGLRLPAAAGPPHAATL